MLLFLRLPPAGASLSLRLACCPPGTARPAWTAHAAAMEWSLEGVRGLVAGGMQSVRECESSALGTGLCLLLLFVWYCYRVGREHGSPPPLRGGYVSEPGPLAAGGGPRMALGGSEAGGARVKGRPAGSAEEQNGFAYCQSAECFRCAHPGEGLNQRLYHSLQDYAKRYTWAGMGRVHKGVREQGRYLSSRASIQKPEVFFLPDLPSAPFFSREAQKHDVELLERSFPALLAEFHSVYQQVPARASVQPPPGWKANGTPRGQWWTFYLVNQGTPLARNARRCPRTWRVLGQLRTFIANNVFGNACFSVLNPGTLVTEHYGPTNVRLRCHLGEPAGDPPPVPSVPLLSPSGLSSLCHSVSICLFVHLVLCGHPSI